MRRWLGAAAAASLLLGAVPAQACLSEPLPQAVLFDRPPAHRPPGYLLLKVVGREVEQDREHLLVRIVEPDRARRLGSVAWLRPESATSCTGWGRLGSEAYAVARVAGRWRGRTLLQAAVYARSRRDALWSWFGWTWYSARGEPL